MIYWVLFKKIFGLEMKAVNLGKRLQQANIQDIECQEQVIDILRGFEFN